METNFKKIQIGDDFSFNNTNTFCKKISDDKYLIMNDYDIMKSPIEKAGRNPIVVIKKIKAKQIASTDKINFDCLNIKDYFKIEMIGDVYKKISSKHSINMSDLEIIKIKPKKVYQVIINFIEVGGAHDIFRV